MPLPMLSCFQSCFQSQLLYFCLTAECSRPCLPLGLSGFVRPQLMTPAPGGVSLAIPQSGTRLCKASASPEGLFYKRHIHPCYRWRRLALRASVGTPQWALVVTSTLQRCHHRTSNASVRGPRGPSRRALNTACKTCYPDLVCSESHTKLVVSRVARFLVR